MEAIIDNKPSRKSPKGFANYAKISIHTCDGHSFLKKLAQFYPQDVPCVYVEKDGAFSPVPLSGPVTYASINMYVENQERQGYVYIWFKAKEDFETIIADIKTRQDAFEPPKRLLYHQDCYGNWYADQSYQERKPEAYIGYNAYIEKINKDIEVFKKNQHILKSIGENKSLNYLLYGPPGTGKTTLIMTIASIHDMPVYVVNRTTRKTASLTPPEGKTKGSFRILLFEDFDRCLEESDNKTNGSYMSDILNTLDGVNSGENVIRFFTGNDCKVIFDNKALINRMSSRFEFHMPTRDMMEAKLAYLLSNVRPELDASRFAPFIDAVAGKITMRPFTSYVLRYLFDDDPLVPMIANVHELHDTKAPQTHSIAPFGLCRAGSS